MGDFSARVGNIPVNSNVERFGENTRNRNGTQIADFSEYNRSKVMNTTFFTKTVINCVFC
jgi:hypothetical protein